MNTLHIAELKARYHLPTNDGEIRARLDRTLRRVAADALEDAVRRANIESREEVCIRSVAAPVRLRLGAQDTTLEHEWSAAIASSIRTRIERGGSDVVRYRNRGHALLDMTFGVAAGELSRVWAWRQLQLWRGNENPDADAGSQLLRALLSEPAGIVATISAAAHEGALPGLVRILPPAAWEKLSAAAVEAAGGEEVKTSFNRAGAPSPGELDRIFPEAGARAAVLPTSDDIHRAVVAVARASWIARNRPTGNFESQTLGALSVLAIIEADPMLLRWEDSPRRALVAAVAAAIGLRSGASRPAEQKHTALKRGDRGFVGGGEELSRLRTRGHFHESERTPVERWRHASEVSRKSGSSDREIAASALEQESASTATSAADQRADGLDADPVASSEIVEDRPLPALDAPVSTRWGGIFFFLHVIAELGLPREIADSASLGRRPTRWVMQQLASDLFALSAERPALLAFIGLNPSDGDPFAADERQTAEEHRALAELSSRVALRFIERVTAAGGELEGSVTDTITAFSRRSAEIGYSPGWIEVRLRLDEVNVAVRRAGLDLDPGWIPWLGVVVKFVYE